MQPQFKLVCYTSNWVFNSGTKGLSIIKMQDRVKSHYWHLQKNNNLPTRDPESNWVVV